jgi:hypothetical protein
MEAVLYEGARPDAAGARRMTRLYIRVQCPRSMVKLRSAHMNQASAEGAVGSTQAALDTGHDNPA